MKDEEWFCHHIEEIFEVARHFDSMLVEAVVVFVIFYLLSAKAISKEAFFHEFWELFGIV